jgi:integrase
LFVGVDGDRVRRSPDLVPVGVQTVAAMCDRVARRCGLPSFRPHDLRRTAITLMIEVAGVEQAQLFAGHKSITTTSRYDMRGKKRMAESVARMVDQVFAA